MDKSSQSYRRMDRVIMNAFIEAALRIPFEKLTVNDITEAAMISRYTFYAHFHDKFEIAERLQDDIYGAFVEFMQEKIPFMNSPKSNKADSGQIISQTILEFSRKYTLQSQVLSGIHTETIDYVGKIKRYFISQYKKQLPNHKNVEMEALIYSNMVMAVSEYFETQKSFSTNGKTITSAYTYAFLYAFGIHDDDLMQKAYNELLKIVTIDSRLQ